MLVLLMACLAEPAAQAAEGMTLKGAESRIFALVYKAGAASSVAHDHVIHATGASGSLAFDPSRADSLAIKVSVPASGLSPDEDAMRSLVGLPDLLTPTQRDEVKGHLLGESQLAGERFPTLSFQSTSVVVEDKTFLVTGDFSLRGVTQSITVPLKVAPTGARTSYAPMESMPRRLWHGTLYPEST